MKYIIALDQGTTSSRAVVFDENAGIVASHAIEFRQIYPKPGWVEHDPRDILSSQTGALKKAVEKAGIDAKDILAIGITNQRETTVLWDRRTGEPVANAIVWQCRRTAPIVEQLKAQGLESFIRERTGLVPDAYFSGTKLKWLFDNVEGAKARAERGELAFGTIDSFLTWHLTGGRTHVTDMTNASRTMLFNIYEQKWDDELLKLLDIPGSILPEVVPSSKIVGYTDKALLGREIPIAALAGDQHAALFGQGCFGEGDCKNTYGTGCFVLMNTGNKPVPSPSGLVTTIGWALDSGVTYALEGSVFVGGAVIQWLRDELKIISTAAESEEVASMVPDTAGVYLVPAFTGLGAPHWDMYARGSLFGLTRGANRAHIVRAALESIAFQSNDVIRAMEKDSGIKMNTLKVDGGASANDLLMQFQSDITGVKVVRPKIIESTALGAAALAGCAVGCWTMDKLRKIQLPDREFTPAMSAFEREKRLKGWNKAVERSKYWENE